MKKLSVILLGLLLMSSVGTALAAYDFDDPVLCVAGEWMMVDAAARSAVYVAVPEGTRYGNQRQGGCDDPAPAKLLPRSHVVERGNGNTMVVSVDGAQASPVITVSYGDSVNRVKNQGGRYTFRFRLDD